MREHHEIALRYGWGKGVPRDVNLAREFMEKSAVQGYAPAQYGLGSMYYRGEGVVRDLFSSERVDGKGSGSRLCFPLSIS